MSLDAGHDSGRLRSLDAYRGFVMLAMASGGIGTFASIEHSGDTAGAIFLQVLLQQLDHVQWRGGVFWDLIQPSFMFLVGAAMPFSFASRRARGQGWLRQFGHALVRSLVLIVLAVFLASNGSPQTVYSFTNVLGQIGLGYPFVFLLLGRRPLVQFAAAIAVLVGYWMYFANSSPPERNFDRGKHGANEPQLVMGGFFAHWNKNTNAAAEFDRWFLNLFPHPVEQPFVHNPGGYATLNFIPSIATMLAGVLAGELLRSGQSPRKKAQILLVTGAACWFTGQLLDASICPVVKRIWTPSWVVASTAWTCWMLAFFYWVIDVAGYRRWSFPLVVAGANSIAIYLMYQLMRPFVSSSLRTHLGREIFSGPHGSFVRGVSFLLVLWLICLWLYERKIFIKI
jgi:heparan-alpha-glucosaminide N-acetyltransferase